MDSKLFDLATFSPKSVQFPFSWVEHLPFAAWIIREVSPRIFVELGSHTGNSYFAFCQAVSEASLATKCYAVDTWQGDEYLGDYGEKIFAKLSSHHDQHYANFSSLLRMTFEEALSYFADESIDLMHINGLHTYEAVRHDFESWLPKLAPRAVVLIHNTNVREHNFGVWKLWKELQAQYPNHLEFVHSDGLGVLQINNLPHGKAMDWLEPHYAEKQRFITYFAALGLQQRERCELQFLKSQVGEFDEQITHIKQILAERNEQIRGLNQSINELDGQVKILNHTLSESNKQNNDLAENLTMRDEIIADLGHDIDGLNCRINVLKQKVQNYSHEINELKNSTSWRITKPVRFLALFMRGQFPPARVASLLGSKRPDSVVKRLYRMLKLRLDKYTSGLNKLPEGFDPKAYLKLNPDVAKVGVDPVSHYLLHGHKEGRPFAVPTLRTAQHIKPNQQTILVVSHDATRTGAPILALNVVQELVPKYNVVAVLLGGGSLTEAFYLAGASVMTAPRLRGNRAGANYIVVNLCAQFNFKFAIVNSIESRLILPSLAHYFIPSVCLIHEFASYTRPRHAFRQALLWSSEVVFSANLTKENAISEYPDLLKQHVHILPQGRCLVPLEEFTESQIEAERSRIRHLIRPKNLAENSLIVLGAGYVQLRKGIDLFIECAARVVNNPEGERCRFVWIGKGFDPDKDTTYSVYLADQIRRAGLEQHVFIIDETTAIDAAYEEADLFLLSSRLDPLPNVAIDAMVHGLPVLCFEKTTGIADFLTECGLGKECVADYLDTEGVADRILALVASQSLRDQVSKRCREAAIAYFDMKKYVSSLETLAKKASKRTAQESLDAQAILASGLFRRDFSCSPYFQGHTIKIEIRNYVRAWACGVDCRKPFPGFHPGIYLEEHGVATLEADPLVDYLQQNRPDGPWCYPVITPTFEKLKNLPENQRVALHIHAYYPKLLTEITSRLSENSIRPDLFVSVTSEDARAYVADQLKAYQGNVAEVLVVPNRGRDIGPLLTALGEKLLTRYDYIGHIHTKKSEHVQNKNLSKQWYYFLLENLVGGKAGPMADYILQFMKEDATVGMVFPDEPSVIGWNANRTFAEAIAQRIGIEKLPDYFNFPVGTMFWARASALAPIMNLQLDWQDYPEEPLPYDGTILHALERLFSNSLSLNNLRYAVTNVEGLTR